MDAHDTLIALDISAIDQFSKATGYARYARDLILALRQYAPPHFKFTVVGSLPQPASELNHVFENQSTWTYASTTKRSGRGAWLLNSLTVPPAARGCAIYHGLYFQVPLFAPMKTVATVYDLMLEIFPEYHAVTRLREYRWNRWLLRHRADGLLAISDQTRRDVIEKWAVSEKSICAVPLGTAFAPAPAAIQRNSQFTILSPYNLEPRKNMRALIEALHLLKAEGRPVKLRLFGKAAWSPAGEEKFEADLARLGIQDLVTRLGVLSDQELAKEMQAAHLFAFPSLYEGFGLPVLEAMASGACVLTANRCPMKDLVGTAGLVTNGVEAASWAESIGRAMDQPTRLAELREAARTRAAQFSLRRLAENTLAYYALILAQP